MRRLSHQLRGSGRTYGFREVTRLCKAMENIMQKLENNKLPADDRIQESLQSKIERLSAIFYVKEEGSTWCLETVIEMCWSAKTTPRWSVFFSFCFASRASAT